jgi:hypothetical protein
MIAPLAVLGILYHPHASAIACSKPTISERPITATAERLCPRFPSLH